MCGICGLSYSNNRTGDREILQEMNAAIRHRGPDSDGFYAAEGVGLAVTAPGHYRRERRRPADLQRR